MASASYGSTVRLWDSATGAPLQTLKGHTDGVSAVAFSPDGRLVASGSDNGTVRLWDSSTGAPLQTLRGHTDIVREVAFSPDGKLVASTSNDDTVKPWDLAIRAAWYTINPNANINQLCFSSDGLYLQTNRGLLSTKSFLTSGCCNIGL